MMLIQAFPSGPFSTNTYVVACPITHEAAILDPAPGSFSDIQAFLANQKLKAQKILLTHSHWDHIADVKPLKEKYAIPVYIHALDAPNLQQPGIDGLPCWLSIPAVKPDILLEEDMHVSVGDLIFQVIHTPGHSPGSVCFYEPQQQTLFSGDTLFKGTIGNLSFPTSQPSLMWLSLAKLAQLPPKTHIFPGHGPATTIESESAWLLNAKKLFDY
jgi:hydroxyacylglutathione hydrolase